MDKPTTNFTLALAVICLLALALRAGSIVFYPVTERYGIGGFGDSHYYHRLAFHLATGQGYSASQDDTAYGLPATQPIELTPAVTRGPTYPVFLATIYSCSETPDTIEQWRPIWQRVRLVQAVLNCVSCVLMALTVLCLVPGNYQAALVSAFLCALDPFGRYYSRAILCESLTSFLVSGFLLCFAGALFRKQTGWSVGAAIFLVLVVLSRPEYLLAGFLVTAILAVLSRRPKKASLTFLASYLSGLLLWTLIGGVVSGFYRPTPAGVLGNHLFWGSFESNDNWVGWNKLPDSLGYSPARKAELEILQEELASVFQEGEIRTEIDDIFRREAIRRYQERPLEVFGCWLGSIPRLWYFNQIQIYPEREPEGSWILFYLIFAGLALRHYPRQVTIPLYALPLYLTLLTIPLHVEPRYCIPLLPVLFILAGLGLHSSFSIPRKRNPLKFPERPETEHPPIG